MVARIRSVVLLLAAGVLLAACPGMGLSSLDTEEGATFPGTDTLDTESPEQKKNREWWDSFYGKSGGGAESDCDFYGNCKSQQKSGSWW